MNYDYEEIKIGAAITLTRISAIALLSLFAVIIDIDILSFIIDIEIRALVRALLIGFGLYGVMWGLGVLLKSSKSPPNPPHSDS